MSDLPQEFDLKFLPDWLKETPSTNRYANYEGDTGSRPRGDRDDRRGPPRGRPGQRDSRPPQGDRPRGPRPGGKGDRPRGDRPGGNRHSGDKRPFDRDRRPGHDAPRPAPVAAPAELRVEFLPEPNAATGIAKQIRSSFRAYAVFGTAKLFLERPERHRVRLTSSKPDVLLYQIDDGPIAFERAIVERDAFQQAKDEYYVEETVQGEPIKGNFANVARCRSTGALLGPTNHHSYQPGLRKLYEERFSRRMSFQQFQQEEIEVIANDQAVADWKEQARTSTTYTTTKEAEPITFKSAFDAEQHFRKTYLPQIVKSGTTLECSGPASRAATDRHVGSAVRKAWEQERLFPQSVVNGLRRFFAEAGLHYFKHRKRTLHVSAIKPLRHVTDQPLSDSITSILRTVEAQPRIKRPDLAKRLLGEHHDAPEAAERKAQLASDVHYLVQMGHLIEFADSSFDLPLGPKGEQEPAKKGASPAAEADASADVETEGSAEPEEPVAVETPSTVAEAEPQISASETAPTNDPLPIPSSTTEVATSVAPPEPEPAASAVAPQPADEHLSV